MKVIGITGGIASGKSMVSKELINAGYTVLDSDKCAHEILKNNEVINKIAFEFGRNVITDNQVNRKELGKIIFNDKNAEKKLNAIVHPLVIDELNKQIESFDGDIIFVDVPLLYEANMESMMDKIIVVYVSREVQINRLMKRDQIDYDYAVKKIESQMSLEKKRLLADFVLENDGDFLDTKTKLYEVIRSINNEI